MKSSLPKNNEDEISLKSAIPDHILNNIYFGDCMDMFKEIPDESIDMIVSSPPYNIGKTKNDRKSLEDYLKWQQIVLKQCYRVLKPSGSIFWQVGTYVDPKGAHIPLDIKFFPILESLQMIPRNRIVWIRPHGMHAQQKFSGRHETILWFTKTMDYKFFLDPIKVPQKYANKKHWSGDNKGELSCDPLGKNPGDVWAFRNVRHNHEEDTIHPTQFPEDLIERILHCTTNEGDVVLDPFMGVGTTAVVAQNFNRSFCGAENDQSYFSVAISRLSGLPDVDGNFPNLKTLRQYVSTHTGVNESEFTFTRQRKGSTPSLTTKANPESFHITEIVERIEMEAENAVYKRLGD